MSSSSAPAIFGQGFRGFRGTPSLPSPVTVAVGDTGAQDQGKGDVVATTPQTLGTLAKDLGIEPSLAEAIFGSLGATADTLVSRLAYAPKAVLEQAVGDLKVNGTPASVMDKADMGRLIAQVVGAKEDDVKTKDKAEKPKDEVELAQTGNLHFRDHLDFMDQGTFKMLPPAELQACLDHYEAVLGGTPPEAHIPSDEQLSALVARLQSGRTPYADFSVWGPFDERTSYMRKFEDQVMIDGVWSRKPLRGPQNFNAWLQSWQVYKVAMCALDVTTPQAMDDYADGIRQLVTLFPASRYPSAWATILLADIEMRSKQWWRILAGLRRAPAPSNKEDKERQWNTVLRMSAFGKSMDSERIHWWNVHVIYPLQSMPSSAGSLVAELDGVPAQAMVFQPAGGKGARAEAPVTSAKKRRGTSTTKGGKGSVGGGGTSHPPGRANEICYGYNDGGCTEPCPQGRRHVCSQCGFSGHRRGNCAKAQGKGNGMANNGNNNPGGGAKNKKRKTGGKASGRPAK